MANIKSAKKRVLVIAKKTAINKARKSALKTAEKKVLAAVVAGDADAAKAAFVEAETKLMKVASKGTIHKNKAARKVSRLAKRLNTMAHQA